jgi:hypothetical protein
MPSQPVSLTRTLHHRLFHVSHGFLHLNNGRWKNKSESKVGSSYMPSMDGRTHEVQDGCKRHQRRLVCTTLVDSRRQIYSVAEYSKR